MEIRRSGCLSNWEATRVCTCCKAELLVKLEDLFMDTWSDGQHRFSGPRFECTECQYDNDLDGAGPDVDLWTLGEHIARDKRTWLANSDSLRVPAPGEYFKMQHRTTPTRRLLAGCLSLLEAKFVKPEDIVVVDIIATDSLSADPARPEFAGCYDNDVIAEVIRRLEEQAWTVEPVRQEADKPPCRLVITPDLMKLRKAGWNV